ncbi:tetratricopeptide repeat protein [Phytohabitans flavus]
MDSPLVLFIAMPGSTMGAQATWTDIEEIKHHLYIPVAGELGEQLGIAVDLRIEKDKTSQGMIHQSMFNEALLAPVYIADLSGANANVYLELGARWALRDNVTVLTCQDLAHDIKFNVSANRVIRYGRGPSEIELARQQIVAAIVEGLRGKHIDSPVRQNAAVVSVSQTELAGLRSEVARLREERGEELVAAALKADHEERIRLLNMALDSNPGNYRAHFQLGVSLRMQGDSAGALTHLQRATRLNPEDAHIWQELGVTQSQHGDLDEAIESLKQALSVDPTSAEAHSNLGGVYRRKSRSDDPAKPLDTAMLRLARDAYQESAKINARDTYPLLNVAKLDLLLAGQDADHRHKALETYRTLEDLARYTARTEGDNDPWRWFDLAEILAVNGKPGDAVEALSQGFARLEENYWGTAAQSASAPLRDFIVTAALPEDRVSSVKAILEEYESRLG